MARKVLTAAALKATQGGRMLAPRGSGTGGMSPVNTELYMQNPYRGNYGPFHPRPSMTFTDGAFSPMAPIQPVPVDEPPPGGQYPDPRYWQYRVGWNLPTPPGTEGLKLASFDQLRVLSQRYSVARACIDLRQQEIRGLGWEISLTKNAAKAYQNSHSLMKDFGQRAAEATRFFKRPDPGYWNFDSFLNALLEEILVYDAMALIFRPKYGARFGKGGRGLLGSDLDSIRLVSGPTIRPLVDLHGDPPAPPAPAYQQYLYGVPRTDYLTIMRGDDIEDYGLSEAKVGDFTSDIMLYAPYWPTRESPYGFPPVERALLPIISGLQKQEFQLDYFTEGTVPAVYISPGDPNITPTQIKELQDALNGIAGDPAYHMKVIVLPPGSKVEPQRPVDLSDSFDYLIQTQVAMAFDVQPIEIGIIPDIGGGQTGPSASGVRFASQESRDVKSRKSTKPLLQWICAIFDYVLQDICGQTDMRFQFEGLADDEDKQAITSLGVEQVQNGIASIDEVRDRLDLPPWGLTETSEPIVMTQQGPIPFSMAPQLIQAQLQQGQQQGQPGKKTTSSQPSVKPKAGMGTTKPNGSHSAPVSPSRPSGKPTTPGHAAAQGAVLRPQRGKTGGTPSRSPVAGSRKRGEGQAPTQGRLRNKAVVSELDALKRHLRKNREAIYSWTPKHIDTLTLARIADDLNSGVLIDVAIKRAEKSFTELTHVEVKVPLDSEEIWHNVQKFTEVYKAKKSQWPGWEHDLGVVGAYKNIIGKTFREMGDKETELRKKAASGQMFISSATLGSLIADETHGMFMSVLTPLWKEAWHLGYEAGRSLVKDDEADFTRRYEGDALDNFILTEGEHWLGKVSRTGISRPEMRSEIIARTEVSRAMNAGALQAYKDNGLSYKRLLIAPDDTCDICKTAARQGVIPLDAIFPGGGSGGPFHPQCRCVPAPADINVVPPQAHLGKNAEDKNRVCWMLFRAKDEEDHWRFLLQQRDDGTWGMPGGHAYKGEDAMDAAIRETTEEIGQIPSFKIVTTFHHVEDDGKQAYLWLCETETCFTPTMDGETPEETAGVGWFRKKEIDKLELTPKFAEDWDQSIDLRSHVTKYQVRVVSPEGIEEFLDAPEQELEVVGARWPYPRRGDGAEDPDGPFGEANAAEPPRWDGTDEPDHRSVPRGGDDGDYPKRRTRNKPSSRFPDQGGQRYPLTSNGGPEANVQGIPKAAPRPAVMTPSPKTPSPSTPMPQVPDPGDPGENVAVETDQGISYYPSAKDRLRAKAELEFLEFRRKLDNTFKAGGPSDYSDPNPVDAEHVYLLMAKNFPPEAIEWVKRARWMGPVNIPWERIDSDGIKTWAAYRQPEKVNDFAKSIQAHDGRVAPSIVIQDNDSPKGIIIDGHHRALARKKLNMPVLSYLGAIDPKDRKAAEETHSKQIHSGSDPRNT